MFRDPNDKSQCHRIDIQNRSIEISSENSLDSAPQMNLLEIELRRVSGVGWEKKYECRMQESTDT